MFNPNIDKLKWSMVWILNNQPCTPNHLTQILFQAEISHLNKYARPITGVNYYKGSPLICLEIEKIYSELNLLNQRLPKINTFQLSISDIKCLKEAVSTKLTDSPYLQSLSINDLINYQKLIFNPEVLAYLKEIDSLNIVI